MMQQRERADALTLSAQEYADEAKELREKARQTDEVLSEIVAEIPACPLRVIDGRLVTNTKRGATFYSDLSAGERWRIALDIAIQAVGTGGLLVIPQEAWEGLDPYANRAAIDAQAKAASKSWCSRRNAARTRGLWRNQRMHQAVTSSLWKYAGLDVAENGQGRSRKAEHLVKVSYVNRDGEEAERNSITFNPFLKTKLIGVLAPSFIKLSNPIYAPIYRGYKHRLESNPAHQEKSKGHRDNMAKRYMIKIFLIDLYKAWRTIEGLPVTPPYHEGKLGIFHRAA
jgi:hypothetical protein